MTRNLRLFSCLSLVLALTVPAQATDVDWFDFSGWDHELVTNGGQQFSQVMGNVDVTVTGTSNQSHTSYYNGESIVTGGNSDVHSFTFTSSSPLDLIIDVQSIDRLERLDITSEGAMFYEHDEGAVPSQNGSLTLAGNGVAFGPDGAARGLVYLDSTNSFTWTYEALAANKYEWFRVGTRRIPEPSSFGMLVLGGLFFIARRRRRG